MIFRSALIDFNNKKINKKALICFQISESKSVGTSWTLPEHVDRRNMDLFGGFHPLSKNRSRKKISIFFYFLTIRLDFSQLLFKKQHLLET